MDPESRARAVALIESGAPRRYAHGCPYHDREELAQEMAAYLLHRPFPADVPERRVLWIAAQEALGVLIGDRTRLKDALVEYPLDFPRPNILPDLSPEGWMWAENSDPYARDNRQLMEWSALSRRERQQRIIESWHALGSSGIPLG